MGQLKKVQDPELHQDLVTLNMVKQVQIADGQVCITIELTTPACPMKDRIRNDVIAAVRELGDPIKQVEIRFTADVKKAPSAENAAANNPLPTVKHIVAVGAGKGGVGKSTVSVNLAMGLARTGAAVGLMDGDIYGPSLPTMLGLDHLQPRTEGNMMLPFQVHGLQAMTIGALVEEEKPLIWRGPMAHGAFRQLATQTQWGELDYLIIDLPPGTGDVPLTMSQLLPLTGAVVVCTPQKVALDDARRAVRMFQQLKIRVLGIVENMSYFVGDDGKEYDIFGRGGAEMMAQMMEIPFLGTIPITMALRHNCDAGDPESNFTLGEPLAQQLEGLSRALAGQISIQSMSEEGQRPSLTIS